MRSVESLWESPDLLGTLKKCVRGVAPEIVKHPFRRALAFLPHGWGRSSHFRKLSKLLENSQYWTSERLEAHQLEHLRRMLAHAASNVEGYARRFSQSGVGPRDVTTLKDLRLFPSMNIVTGFGPARSRVRTTRCGIAPGLSARPRAGPALSVVLIKARSRHCDRPGLPQPRTPASVDKLRLPRPRPLAAAPVARMSESPPGLPVRHGHCHGN